MLLHDIVGLSPKTTLIYGGIWPLAYAFAYFWLLTRSTASAMAVRATQLEVHSPLTPMPTTDVLTSLEEMTGAQSPQSNDSATAQSGHHMAITKLASPPIYSAQNDIIDEEALPVLSREASDTATSAQLLQSMDWRERLRNIMPLLRYVLICFSCAEIALIRWLLLPGTCCRLPWCILQSTRLTQG